MDGSLLRPSLLAVVVLVLGVEAPSAQAHKLSGALALKPEQGDARSFVVTPDGQRVVFVGDLERDEVVELWSAPVDRSAPPIKLSGKMVNGGDVLDATPAVSADNLVVYSADAVEDDHAGLYVVPVDGSAPPVELFRGPYFHVPAAVPFRLTLDGSQVLFVQLGGVAAVPIDASTPPVSIAPGGTYGNILVSPDGARVVSWDGYGIWSARIDGSSTPIQIGDVGSQNSGLEFEFSADGQRLVYHGNVLTGYFSSFELGVAWTDGSAPALVLSTSPVEFEAWQLFQDGQSLLVGEGLTLSVRSTLTGSSTALATLPSGAKFRWVALTPDEQWALSGYSSTGSGGANRLLRVRTDGSTVGTLVPGPWVNLRRPVQFTSDGTRAILAGSNGIYALATDWTTPLVTIAGNGSGNNYPNAILLAGDQDVLLNVDGAASADSELYVRRLDASLPAQRLDSGQTGRGVVSFAVAGNGTDAVWLQVDGPNSDPETRVFGRPLDGSLPPSAFHDLPDGVVGNVTSFVASRDGKVALYLADIAFDEHFELVAVEPFAPRGPQRLNPSLAGNEDVVSYTLSPDGTRAAFWMRGPTASTELWCARTDGSLPPVLLATTNTSWTDTPTFTLDGQRVLFGTAQTGLQTRPVDGSAPAVDLVPSNLTIRQILLAPDGVHALVRGSFNGPNAFLRVTVDGSAASLELLRTSVFSSELLDPRLDGNEIYYRADPTDGTYELFRLPFDGSGGPTRLSPTLVAGGSVTQFELVNGVLVFRADATVNERFELYRHTGVGTSVLLTPIWDLGDVEPDFLLTDSGATVVFRASPEAANRVDLMAVPTDGSAAPTLLARAPSGARDVLHFALDSKSGQIAYGTARTDTPFAFDLSMVSLAGGPSRLLDEKVGNYGLTPDGRVVWSTYFLPVSLFATRVAGGPIERMVELPNNGSIPSFQATQGGRVFFSAHSLDHHLTTELFLSFTGSARRPAGGAPGDGGTVVR